MVNIYIFCLDHLNSIKSNVNGADESTFLTSLPEEDSGRTKIILDLSSQISEQDARITDLQNKLTEKDKLLQQLQGQSSSRPGSVKGQGSRSSNSKVSPKGDSSWGSLSDQMEVISPGKSPRNRVSGDATMESEGHQRSRISSKHKSQVYAEGPPESGNVSELKAIAQEMKKLKKKKKKDISKILDTQSANDFRESSGISRDSGVISMETDLDGSRVNSGHRKNKARISSATSTSTLSAFSDTDADLDLDNCDEPDSQHKKASCFSNQSTFMRELNFQRDNPEKSKTFLDPASIRQISAPKGNRKHQESDYDFIDRLLKSDDNDVPVDKKSVSGKPPRYKPSVTTY